MGKYIIKRLIYSLLTIWIIITVTFALMHTIPGNPFTRAGGKNLSPEVYRNMTAKYNLDKSLFEQYTHYIGGVVTKFDLGMSINDNRSVNEIIANQFPYSAAIGLEAMIFATALGVLLGIWAAVKRNTAPDYTINVVTVFGISVPAYVLGLIMQYTLGYRLGVLPLDGFTSFQSTIMPSFAISFSVLATIIKFMRSNMIDVLNQDYIKTAKSKGISTSAVLWKHTVRNAILPVITIVGPMFVSIIMGTVIIERIFSIPGLGSAFVDSVSNRDYTLIMGTTIFYSIFLIGANFIVDLLYGVVDPRIRLAK